MSLLDKASLIVTPNAYKEDVLYSVIPSDGSGDMNVVRATTATRVNAEGLIEEVPYNLLQRSEEFDNAYWGKTAGTTVTANTTISPNGTSTADTAAFASSGDSINKIILFNVSVVNGTTYTFSLYTKTPTQIIIFGGATGGSGTNVFNGSIDVGNGWYRQSITRTWSASGTVNIQNIIFLGASGSVFIWGAQLVTGTSAKEYFQTTDRLNIPRIDYTNGGCPSILVEPQRTNLVLRSEEFDNASWVKNSVSVTANNTSSPSGTMTADLVANTSAGGYINNTSFVGSTGSVYSFSFYIKNNTSTSTLILVREGSSALSATINWSGANISSITNTIGSISSTALTNGWFRIMGTYTALENNQQIRIYPQSVSGTNSVFLWGAQLELGSNATSYIPTVASAVTRNADVISKTGISSLIGQTEGTMFVDFDFINNNSEGRISISNGTNSDRILIIKNISNTLRFFVSRSNISQLDFTTINSFLNNQKIKIAFSLKTASFKIFINGVVVYSQNTGTYPSALQQFSFTDALLTSPFFGNINSALLFPTALTDQQCIELTTL